MGSQPQPSPHLQPLAFLVCLILVTSSFLSSEAALRSRTKRQLFREQVLPLSGGKIPEDAFRSDRLALNRLNKEGIAVPDGVLFEARHRESHWKAHRHDPEIDGAIIKLIQKPDGRYAPPEGRYPFNNLVESTYVIRPPINIRGWRGPPPRKPVQTTLQLPARPFFPEDEEVLDNDFELLNTINTEFPGTRLWTGFGPLFHETADRILRHSGSRKLPEASRGKLEERPFQVPQPAHQVTRHSNGIQGGGGHKVANSEKGASLLSHQQLVEGPSRQQAADETQPQTHLIAPQQTPPEAGSPPPQPQAPALRRPQQVDRTSHPKTHLTAPPPLSAGGHPPLHRLPAIPFQCQVSAKTSMQADPQTSCQVFHVCHPDGRKESYLCPRGTRYDVSRNLCTVWSSVPCPGST